MKDKKLRVVVGVTAASGSLYARLLIDELLERGDQVEELALVFSDNAAAVWQHELGSNPLDCFPVKTHDNKDFSAPFASGSSQYDALVLCPCSMGTIGRVATGVSDSLITRCADVMLKERKKLILVARETPLNLIHLRNMCSITEAGGIICPATPSFYSRPSSVNELAMTVVARVIQLLGLPSPIKAWEGFE